MRGGASRCALACAHHPSQRQAGQREDDHPAPTRHTAFLGCVQVYHADSGKPAKLRDVVAAMAGADVVLLGEYHDDPVSTACDKQRGGGGGVER